MNYSIGLVGLPFLAAMLFALSAAFTQQSSRRGIGPWRLMLLGNATIFILYLPLLTRGFNLPQSLILFWPPLVCGFLFYLGQGFTVLALHKGDVSLVTPVMGLKVIIVTVLTAVLLGDKHGIAVWIAAFLSVLGVYCLKPGSSGRQPQGGFYLPMTIAISSMLSFGFVDIMFQRWISELGYVEFMLLSMFCATIFSGISCLIFARKNMPREKRVWLAGLAGSVLFGISVMVFSYAIGHYKNAAVTNIIYSSRGVCGVILVALAGRQFGMQESGGGSSLLWKRLAGSLLIIGAVLITLVG